MNGTSMRNRSQSNFSPSQLRRRLAVSFWSTQISTGNNKNNDVEEESTARIPLLLQLTGLYFLGSKHIVLRTFRVLVAVTLCAFVTYQAMNMMLTAILNGHLSAQMAHTMVNFNWMLQALISMAFLLYWQACGHLPALFSMMGQFRGFSPRWMHKCAAIAYGTLFLLDAAVVALILSLHFGMGEFEQPGELSEHDRMIEVYAATLLQNKLFIPVHYYTRFVWLVVLIVFISAASGIQHRIRAANERLRQLGDSSVEPVDPPAFGDALNGQLMEHMELARWIRSVDSVFGIYTFLMVCLNIPVFIFSLSMLLLTLPNRPQWMHIVVPLVDILFSLCQLLGLTIIPAKIHTRIHEVEKIIFDNVYIWRNLNTRIYQLANAFIMYANQPCLGITLWGFAVIRKPLILTTISLTATYLTVIIQFHSVGPDACPMSNSTAEVMMTTTNGAAWNATETSY